MAYDPFRNYTGVLPRVKTTPVAGGAAGALTLTGITTADRLLSVWHLAPAGGEGSAIATGYFQGAYTVLAGDDTANTVSIPTGAGGLPDVITGLTILRSGAVVSSNPAVSLSGANLVVADGATYVLTTGDVIHWQVYRAAAASLDPGAAVTLAAPADLTSEFTISDTSEIDNTGGTDTTGGILLVTWEDHDLGETSNPAHLDDA